MEFSFRRARFSWRLLACDMSLCPRANCLMGAYKALNAGELVGLVGVLVDGDQDGLSIILIFKLTSKMCLFKYGVRSCKDFLCVSIFSWKLGVRVKYFRI